MPPPRKRPTGGRARRDSASTHACETDAARQRQARRIAEIQEVSPSRLQGGALHAIELITRVPAPEAAAGHAAEEERT